MELLIRIVDKKYPDGKTSPELAERGDVIAIGEDGHDWTEKEKSNPDWVICKLPQLTRVAARALLSSQKPPDLNDDYVLRKRAVKIDLDAVEEKIRNKSVRAAELISAIVTKEPPSRRVRSVGPDKGRIG
jgi:hypothetical protein